MGYKYYLFYVLSGSLLRMRGYIKTIRWTTYKSNLPDGLDICGKEYY